MEGKKELNGRIQIQGSKNAALPILAACMLIPDKCLLKGCPDITDIGYMCSLLKSAGAVVDTKSITEQKGSWCCHADQLLSNA